MRARLLLLFALLPAMAAAQTYTYSTLVNFAAPSGPFGAASLTLDAQGNIYGSTRYGGIYNSDNGGDGTVYKVTPSGVLTVLHSFGSGNDGQNPIGPVTRDTSGNIYGTTNNGGAHGSGTIFEVRPNGAERVLYSFPNSNGIYIRPQGGVTLDSSGNIYGISDRTIQFYPDGGDIFQLTPTGVFSILYTWCTNRCSTEPNSPAGPLVPNGSGGFYGMTVGSGQASGTPGNLFEFSPQSGMTVLHTFTSGGGEGAPVLDAAGNLFGIEGIYFGTAGGIFELSAGGVESTLYTFPTGFASGEFNGGTPVLDSAGNLYNTTQTSDDSEIVYKVSPAGVETDLYTGTAAQIASVGVVMDKAGNLYGTCYYCGASGRGLIYKLSKN